MEITSQMVKELRDKTNAGMMDCKKALSETGGDMEKAVDFLRKKGLAVAQKRADRATSEGIVETYIHAGGKLGVMVEIGCESDFVAKSDMFKAFAKDVAMHIAACNPLAIKREEIAADLVARETEIFKTQLEEADKKSGKPKPAEIAAKIITGKLDKFYADNCLMEQVFVKNDKLTIQDLLNEIVAKIGENIAVKRFARFQVGV